MVEYLNEANGLRPVYIPPSRVCWRSVDHEDMAASIRHLNLNLYFCSKLLSQEAAAVFYKNNTFSFLGDHNWDPIVA